jgi:microsomal dipeptidase-like Zn-dependent dipeptidase
LNKKVAYYADIHLHASMKPANSGHPKPKYNLWEDFGHLTPTFTTSRFVSRNSMQIAKYTQSNLMNLARGNVRVFFNSLYPIEKGFLNLRNIPTVLTRKKVQHELIGLLTGMDPKRVEYLQKHADYFKELHEEYHFMVSNQGVSPDGQYRHEIAKNYTHLQEILKEKNTLSSIVTVEGAHVFFDKKMLSGKLQKPEMKHQLHQNILAVKEWEHPPFMINLAHHFYNELCGHAKSFFKIEIAEGLLNQKKGLNLGLEGLGIKALKEMLSSRNGKRIHIDTKHMSMKSRQEYYRWIESYNYLNESNNIPIISSHTGVNGYKTMSGSVRASDDMNKIKEGYFFRWSLNISDEEINIIHRSNGILGIMIDETKLGGGKFYASLTKLGDDKAIKDAYLKLIWDNIMQVVDAVGAKSGWDIIAMGTDYDGAIQHVQGYDSADKMPLLYNDLLTYLEENKYQKQLWYGYEPVEIMNKIFLQNTMQFLERYFV